MSSRKRSLDEMIAIALAEGRAKGLPEDWGVKFDNRNRRKWISPGPQSRTFDSLPKAIARAKKLSSDKQKGNAENEEAPSLSSSEHSRKRTAVVSTNGRSKRVRKTKGVVAPDADSETEEITEPTPSLDADESFSESKENIQPITTVHWDPNGFEGSIVGYRIRVFDLPSKSWKPGRILQYDGHMMHEVRFYNSTDEYNSDIDVQWIRIKEEVVQIGSRFVWALVRGFAWWPAQVLICEESKDGYVFVEFLGSEQVATIKDSTDLIRPFNNGEVDSYIRKNKRKRNEKAVEVAREEQNATLSFRKDAIHRCAAKAFECVNKIAGGYLGRKIQIFRSDINYPDGVTLNGYVRQYSSSMKKWLVSYDDESTPASWINFTLKEYNHKFVDNQKSSDGPTSDDLKPFVFGLEEGEDNARCKGCLCRVAKNSNALECKICHGIFHPTCLDPPVTSHRTFQKIEEGWTCSRCIPCLGCKKLDIGFGVRSHQIPPTLALEKGTSLKLCSVCIPLYEKNRYCANCGHTTMDDITYQRAQKILKEYSQKRKDAATTARTSSDDEENNGDCTDDDQKSTDKNGDTSTSSTHADSGKVDSSWFLPDSAVWGYNEGSMLQCDSCNLWVHAGCADLTREEYELTSAGNHEIYSKEFLCRTCCKNRCISIVKALQDEDSSLLFAVPVTEDVAPTYTDVVKQPMDLQTMMLRAENNRYFNYAWVRECCELMVLNALNFNRFHSKCWNEAKRFHDVCVEKIFPKKAKAAPSVYKEALEEAFAKAEWEVANEIDREKQDESTEKKDLVGGADVVTITLPPLRSSLPDPESVIPLGQITLKPVDAHYCAWMDACFICGSSGASDTMLFCVDCGEAFHSFCVCAPIHCMSEAAVAAWRCPNCKLCEITGDVPPEDTDMLYCDMCDRAFTLDLLDPPLDTVPSGLWVCGQCVACKVCKNEGDNDKVSLKYWSRDPELCYRCGGCRGLIEKDVMNMDCPVCHKLWRHDDNDLVQCKSCNLSVHDRCDDLAMKITQEKGNNDNYECPPCRKKKESTLRNTMLVKSFKSQLNDKSFFENSSFSHISDPSQASMLRDQILDYVEMEMLKSWAQAFQSVIDDGRRIFTLAEESLGENFANIILDSTTRLSNKNERIYHRAARWIRHMKINPDFGIPDKHCGSKYGRVSSLVAKAKNSSAFIEVACHHIGLSLRIDVKTFEIIECISNLFDASGDFTFSSFGLNVKDSDVTLANDILTAKDATVKKAEKDLLASTENITPKEPEGKKIEKELAGSIENIRTEEEGGKEAGKKSSKPTENTTTEERDGKEADKESPVSIENITTGEQKGKGTENDLSGSVENITTKEQEGKDAEKEKESPGSIENMTTDKQDSTEAEKESPGCIENIKTEEQKGKEAENELPGSIENITTKEHDGKDAEKELPSVIENISIEGQEGNNNVKTDCTKQATSLDEKNTMPIPNEEDKKILSADEKIDSEKSQDESLVLNDNPLSNNNPSSDAETSSVQEEETSNNNQKNIYPRTIKNVEKPLAKKLSRSFISTPMLGWDAQLTNLKSNQKWKDPRICSFCHTCGDCDAGLPLLKHELCSSVKEESEDDNSTRPVDLNKIANPGRLLPLGGGIWVHASCALWSSEVWESDKGDVHAIDKARYRGSKLKCFGCGRPGATLGCHRTNCPANYHFSCATACGGTFTASKQVFCYKHRKDATEILSRVSYEPMKRLRAVTENVDQMNEGNLCSRFGALIVHSLGSIEQENDGFHDKNYLFPVGYVASRIFWSYRGIRKRTVYILKVDRSAVGKPIFIIAAGDDARSKIQCRTMYEAFDILLRRVSNANKESFSNVDDLNSFLPTRRLQSKSFNLNAPQFFGFGYPKVREAIENLPDTAAAVVPLSPNSKMYEFCFKLPTEEHVITLQRKRAAVAAEQALENWSGCARAEGTSAIARSTGSGRITRALVGNKANNTCVPVTAGNTNLKNGSSSARTRRAIDDSTGNSDSHQVMYREMKNIPLGNRLAAMRSHIHGWGLFTKINIAKDEMIIEYMGECVRQCIADRREHMYETSGIGSCYMFRLDMNRIVDATTIGCMARFMNHCCSPNAYAKVITVEGEKGADKKIVVFALKDIMANEEITYDYKFPVEDGSLRCTCGAPNCIGRMN